MPHASFTITVPSPCHQDWELMTPADQGRHCAACAQVVVDFSPMTDAELLTWFDRAGAATCGNFRPDQLNRPLLRPAAPPPPPVVPRWQAWLAAAEADAARYGSLIPQHLRLPKA